MTPNKEGGEGVKKVVASQKDDTDNVRHEDAKRESRRAAAEMARPVQATWSSR